MKTDYKFWYIKRDDDGFITEVAIRFYEGDVATQNELNSNYELVPVTRYRRTKRLDKLEVPHIKTEFIKEKSGKDCAIYYPKDFGNIKTKEELCIFLNGEIAKDTQRVVINEQKL